jgi:hypothetical protein
LFMAGTSPAMKLRAHCNSAATAGYAAASFFGGKRP